ncbi:uncharacterized protein BDW70DRAFT_137171 [Aspergillus foveolatus]|uniref:uncharacterized protein n=1 Tax=Aspergillus foveolatus TaxID=210207 RepID=UPI003CCC97FF
MRKLLLDQRNLTPSLFTNVPWSIASDMWAFLGRCKRQTLHVWKLLATVYPAHFAEVEQYRSMKIEGPKLSMREYLGLVKSDSLSWRVVLTLATSYARVPEIIGISELKNLCALDVATPARPDTLLDSTDLQLTALTDRIVRSWSESAQTGEAFSHLRVLVLRHQTSLSKIALHYLRSFPRLQSVVAFGCPGIESALFGGDVDGWAVAEVKRSAPATLYENYEAICKAAGADSIPAERPVLDFQIGELKDSRESARAPYSTMYLQRTGGAPVGDSDLTTRKRKWAVEGSHAQSRRGKAVMKDRTRDIGDVLSSFF